MNRTLAATLAACSIALPVLAQDNPFAAFRGKMRDGNWEYKMQMEGMPGMPPGAKAHEMTIHRCLTPQDVDKGGFAQRDGKMPDGCAVKDMKISGNTANWRMECTKDPKMASDVSMTFVSSEQFTMKQKMTMAQDGQTMVMGQSLVGRYTGPCTAKDAPK